MSSLNQLKFQTIKYVSIPYSVTLKVTEYGILNVKRMDGLYHEPSSLIYL